ncbi:MAG: hypothetical protein AAF762_07525 [Pseudomonadota bacterium]
MPLAALAILSTLFLLSESLDPNRAIPYAEVDVERILREQGVTRPTFGGATGDDTQVTLRADAVRPVENDALQLAGTALDLVITLPGDREITVVSEDGRIDASARTVAFPSGAILNSSLGYRIETEAILTAAFDQVMAETAGPVRVVAPGTKLDAGAMTLSRHDARGDFILVFKDGVRLVYTPTAIEETE